MTQQDNGGPAFPHNFPPDSPFGDSGMTLRDKIVIDCIAAAFGGDPSPIQIADGQTVAEALREHWDAVVLAAHIAADAMIAARKVQP